MDKVYIVSIFNIDEDFIRLQYESIVKHVKGDYVYLVFNNAFSDEQANKNKQVCDELNIECIRININYDTSPSNIAGQALNESFKYLSDKMVFKIDSDMFFISDVNILDLCSNYDLVYAETHGKIIPSCTMWSGFFGINMKKIDIPLNFNPHVIENTDTFGQSCLLTANPKYTRKKMYLYCILDNLNGVITGLINNDCPITLTDYKLTFFENNLFNFLHDKLPSKYLEIVKTMESFNFPKPYHIDIITLDDVDVIIHFKSSNHDDIYNNIEYKNSKKNALKNFLAIN